MPLTGTQRKRLRGFAHALEPVVHVGQKGLTPTVIEETDRALGHHELIKVKIAADRDERKELATQLARRTRAHVAGIVGSIAILYRQHPEPEMRRVQLS